jgi:hypothetical protein
MLALCTVWISKPLYIGSKCSLCWWALDTPEIAVPFTLLRTGCVLCVRVRAVHTVLSASEQATGKDERYKERHSVRYRRCAACWHYQYHAVLGASSMTVALG